MEKITNGRQFSNRQEISDILGGDVRKGIAKSAKYNVILLFVNDKELYTDKFYNKNGVDYLMYTGIGRIGHQDSITNKYYDLNMNVLTHKANNYTLLAFSKDDSKLVFRGVFNLFETHQNEQLDDNNELRRVFVFHLKKSSDTYFYEPI